MEIKGKYLGKIKKRRSFGLPQVLAKWEDCKLIPLPKGRIAYVSMEEMSVYYDEESGILTFTGITKDRINTFQTSYRLG